MVREVVVLFAFLIATTIERSEAQSFSCNRSEVSNYYVKECANAVRLNPERFSFRCGRFNRRSHALRPNPQLAAAARKHAADMASKNYFSHRSRDGRSFSDRIRNEGYNGWMIGENLAMGYNSALGAIAGWMCSEGHRRNLMVSLTLPPHSLVRTRPVNSMKSGLESSVVGVFVTLSKSTDVRHEIAALLERYRMQFLRDQKVTSKDRMTTNDDVALVADEMAAKASVKSLTI